MNRNSKFLLLSGIFVCVFVTMASVLRFSPQLQQALSWPPETGLEKSQVAAFLDPYFKETQTPESNQLVRWNNEDYMAQYFVDTDLQTKVSQAFARGQVAHGAFVALDAVSGRVVAMVSHGYKDNLSLMASFPSASIFKIITAAAALDQDRLTPSSLIPLKGSYHTLYRQNIMNSGGLQPAAAKSGRYWRLMSLADAFGWSVNSIFGKIGIFGLGAGTLKEYAHRFFFQRPIPFEASLEESKVKIPEDDPFGLAESASGFTRDNTISPVHGALIAAAAANEGVMMEPTVVSQIYDSSGKVVYASLPQELGRPIRSDTADALKKLMERTITRGTSRSTFRNTRRNMILGQLELGGKTGTLDGESPPGRYDWFVGYAIRGSQKLAFAALCIHGTYRGIKASQVARIAIENYFKPDLAKHSSTATSLRQ
jgi:cell division protein FtsI/penicillin-binding protein 2